MSKASANPAALIRKSDGSYETRDGLWRVFYDAYTSEWQIYDVLGELTQYETETLNEAREYVAVEYA